MKKLLKGGKFLGLMKLPKHDLLKEHLQPTWNSQDFHKLFKALKNIQF